LAIATAVNLLDVQDVVIGGGVRGAWDLLEPALNATLQQNQPVSGYPLVVVPSALGGHSVALGAAALAWRLLDRSAQGQRPAVEAANIDNPNTTHVNELVRNAL
jgi:glucokinase